MVHSKIIFHLLQDGCKFTILAISYLQVYRKLHVNV